MPKGRYLFQIKPTKRTYSAFEFPKRFPKRLYAEINGTIKRFGKDLVNKSRSLIEKSVPQGRTYFFRDTGLVHRASAPGQPPAVLTGKLISKLVSKTYGGGTMLFGVRKSVPYASALEWGGYAGKGYYIQPRPFLRPAIDSSKQHAINMFQPLLHIVGKKYVGYKFR
jgi:phage gpG-like protein